MTTNRPGKKIDVQGPRRSHSSLSEYALICWLKSTHVSDSMGGPLYTMANVSDLRSAGSSLVPQHNQRPKSLRSARCGQAKYAKNQTLFLFVSPFPPSKDLRLTF
ncbi:hypothetical protein PoB_003440600 [Plakobranchus ocellatus]|uniref:Uncharacterized protein n=1 Tax=Plakobranchus ocellatus TaxID=259542 RepID=A0AAV4A9N8_9GAST|nr:hypothetical protein PoB_003440600 [Plakobranchus ocellatus]